MLRKFFCFARRSEAEAGGNAPKESKASYGVNWAGFNPQNPLDFAQRKFGFRPIDTTKIYLQRDLPRSGLRPARRSVAEERAGDFKL